MAADLREARAHYGLLYLKSSTFWQVTICAPRLVFNNRPRKGKPSTT
jgi:hypothetical protein